MKISKLFHWLYAILMLLPFAFFVPSVLYYAFNDNSTMQTVEVPKTETISVDFNQYVVNGNFDNADDWTRYDGSLTRISVESNKCKVTIVNNGVAEGYRYGIYTNVPLVEQGHIYIVKCSYDTNLTNPLRTDDFGGYADVSTNGLRFINNSTSKQLIIRPRTGVGLQIDDYFEIYNVQVFDLTKMFGSGNEPTLSRFNELFTASYYQYNQGELMQITYDTGETEQLVSNTDIINYAWESIWDLPLFNWCKVSFVSVPFTYITGLFGLAASNSFNYVFTYFASMSIIWLVFDVIMYVPLLVHRWIDKGIVE